MATFTKLAALLCLVNLGYFVKNVSAVTAEIDLAVTPNERKILETFRQRMAPKLYKDYMKDDLYLLRFLRVKEFNLREAESLLNENIEWRKENKMDTIHEEDWQDMKREYPYSIAGHDKAGRPVGTVNLGNWDIRKAVIQGKLTRLGRYMDKMMDEISMKVVDLRAEGKNVTRWVLLANVQGFNVIQHACTSCTSLWVNFLRSYEHHFPNSANSIYTINSPDTFHIVYRLLQPSIPRTSKEAIKILGSSRAEWKSYLDRVIEPSQRTKEYGGTLE